MCEVMKLFLLHLDDALGLVMGMESSLEILPVDILQLCMCLYVGIPLVNYRSFQLVRS
jgi:hypothetical protein